MRETALLAHEPAADEARIVGLLGAWMDEDRKVTPLKTLQGLIWAQGYARGELEGHVYADAATELRGWHAAGMPLFVYSSGSIAAQKLLFGHSSAGNLAALFGAYFDTTIGPKTDADSYRRIAQAINVPASDVLFLSDREAELEAAAAAGWQVACLARPVDTPEGVRSAFPAFVSFADIAVERIPLP